MFFSESIHPFCEGRLSGAEYFNTVSSALMFVWSLYKLRTYSKTVYWSDFLNIFNILSINCLCSALFHGTLWMGFKLFDEMSMIIPLWSGIIVLLKLNVRSRSEFIYMSYMFHVLNLCMLVFNCFKRFQWLFPFLFTGELFGIIWYYRKLIKCGYEDSYSFGTHGIYVCSFAGILWWITETFCAKYMRYGHAIWHILMPYGVDCICQYILTVKKKKYREFEFHRHIIV